MSDSSDSEMEVSSKSKTKKSTVFDNDIFDAEESDEKSKSINRKKKINQQQSQSIKKSFVKLNNEQTKKDKLSKVNDEQSTGKKKITIPKTIEKKKLTINSTKSTSKIPKTTTTPAQKRPSTDESNESIKKFKIDDEKSKTPSIEEQISSTTNQIESEISTSNKPSIVITSPTKEPSSNLPKIDEPPIETNPQTTTTTTPTKFGIVFTSHHRHSTTTPSSIRTQSTETSISHDTSKNDDEDMEEDNESGALNNKTITKNDQLSTNTLKPPTAAQTSLSDDETLNPETMQLSDLIGGSRREGTKSVQSRSATKGTGKGKRASKQDTSSNKRQQTKANSKAILSTVSNEKESESTVEQTPSMITTAKRLSTTEASSISSPKNDKESKRLRKSTDDSTVQSQVKLEPVENLSQWANTQIKGETIEPRLSSETNKKQIIDQSQVTSMETDQIPSSSSSSILTSTTSPETEHAIKAVYSTIQIPQPSVSKSANREKLSPIIAPISKETLPIVEHKPTSIQTTSILPSHVSIKSSLTSATFSMSFDISYIFKVFFCFFFFLQMKMLKKH
jgi:hypothetical protein